jgi:hypothetical protein
MKTEKPTIGFKTACGIVHVVVTGLKAHGRMSVLICAWTGSGFPMHPTPHSLN